jgi:hypothetical protein
MSAREAEEFESMRPELEKELEQLFVVDPDLSVQDAAMQDITDQLIAAGTEPSAAKQQAQVMRGLFNLDERMGFKPGTLLERMFAGVKRALPEGMGFDDVDVLVDPLLDRLRSGDYPSQREMRGQSLIEMIKEKGNLADEGGELASRDLTDLINKGTGKSKGLTLDGMAEIAHEAGFIAERDPDLLLEAIEREKSGNPVYGSASPGNPELLMLADALDQLGSFIEAEGIDLEVMTNAEVRKLLAAGEKFDQIDTTELDELTELVFTTAEHDPAMLARATELMPSVYSRQDFGNVEIADTFRVEETGGVAEVREFAQKRFDRAIKRRNVLRKLWKCVSG